MSAAPGPAGACRGCTRTRSPRRSPRPGLASLGSTAWKRTRSPSPYGLGVAAARVPRPARRGRTRRCSGSGTPRAMPIDDQPRRSRRRPPAPSFDSRCAPRDREPPRAERSEVERAVGVGLVRIMSDPYPCQPTPPPVAVCLHERGHWLAAAANIRANGAKYVSASRSAARPRARRTASSRRSRRARRVVDRRRGRPRPAARATRGRSAVHPRALGHLARVDRPVAVSTSYTPNRSPRCTPEDVQRAQRGGEEVLGELVGLHCFRLCPAPRGVNGPVRSTPAGR